MRPGRRLVVKFISIMIEGFRQFIVSASVGIIMHDATLLILRSIQLD